MPSYLIAALLHACSIELFYSAEGTFPPPPQAGRRIFKEENYSPWKTLLTHPIQDVVLWELSLGFPQGEVGAYNVSRVRKNTFISFSTTSLLFEIPLLEIIRFVFFLRVLFKIIVIFLKMVIQSNMP